MGSPSPSPEEAGPSQLRPQQRHSFPHQDLQDAPRSPLPAMVWGLAGSPVCRNTHPGGGHTVSGGSVLALSGSLLPKRRRHLWTPSFQSVPAC